eukprot:1187765-Prorocentrum_minimum.AAC.3
MERGRNESPKAWTCVGGGLSSGFLEYEGSLLEKCLPGAVCALASFDATVGKKEVEFSEVRPASCPRPPSSIGGVLKERLFFFSVSRRSRLPLFCRREFSWRYLAAFSFGVARRRASVATNNGVLVRS